MAKEIDVNDLNVSVIKTIIDYERKSGKRVMYVLLPDSIFHLLKGNPSFYWPASVFPGLCVDPHSFVIAPEDGVSFDL